VKYGFTKEQIELIEKTCIPKEAEPEHKDLLLYYAQKYGLDPLTKEIVLDIRTTKHGDKKPVIITTRDGYLKVAMQDPSYNGVNGGVVKEGDTFEIDPIKGVLRHCFGEKRGKIVAGWAVAKAKDRDPIMFVADFVEYFQANASSHVWKGYPSVMIQKVAEIGAMKRQFNITGMVGAEEIESPVEIHFDEAPEIPIDLETSEVTEYVYTVVLMDKEPTKNLKDNMFNIQAIIYQEGETSVDYDGSVTLKVPNKFEKYLTEGAALKVRGEIKDNILTAKEVEPETGSQESTQESVKEKEDPKNESTATNGDIVTLTSRPKEVSLTYKGQDINKPYATGEYPGYSKAFVIGDAIAPFMPGDVLEIKIVDREERDGIIKLFVSEAKKIEQKLA
jgi:phage recombination protein Bet